MKRRDFMKLAGAGTLSLAAQSALGQEQPDRNRPNILWIACDDMSADLGCFGDSFSLSPNLDACPPDPGAPVGFSKQMERDWTPASRRNGE